MDIVIEGRSGKRRMRWLLAVVGVLTLAGAIRLFLWSTADAAFTVDRDSLVLSEVRRGDFSVVVRGTGVLAPERIQWLSAGVDARVEALPVKAGSIVREGDLIVDLSNPQLVQELAEAQWELEALIAALEAARVAQETELLEQQAQVLNAKLDYEGSVMKMRAEATLLEQTTGAISRLTHEQTKLATAQFKDRWEISQAQLEKMGENLTAQNTARQADLNRLRKRVERMQQQVDELKVLASFDSIVLDVPLEVGQRVPMGANIAKLAQQDRLIAELRIPELQIRDVAVGNPVVIDTRNSLVNGVVSRIEPAVVGGNVQVDVAFPDGLPPDARADLSVEGRIKVADIDDTVYVDRPLFAQSQGRATFYRVSDDGRYAERTLVTLGQGSVSTVQVLEGLAPGDRIVTSDPTRFEAFDRFRIN